MSTLRNRLTQLTQEELQMQSNLKPNTQITLHNLVLHPPQAGKTSTFQLLWTQLRRWICSPTPQPLAYPVFQYQRCLQRGIEIIKRFEGFPADVEPNLSEAEQAVRELVAVPLTPNQFAALVSFTYHLGAARLQQSALLKYLNAGRYRAAAKEFEQWVYVGNRRWPQLAARRLAEKQLFLSPNHQ